MLARQAGEEKEQEEAGDDRAKELLAFLHKGRADKEQDAEDLRPPPGQAPAPAPASASAPPTAGEIASVSADILSDEEAVSEEEKAEGKHDDDEEDEEEDEQEPKDEQDFEEKEGEEDDEREEEDETEQALSKKIGELVTTMVKGGSAEENPLKISFFDFGCDQSRLLKFFKFA